LLLDHLRMQTAEILSLPSSDAIDEEIALHDIGLDSLMAVELRNKLQTSLQRQLSATLILDYPTLQMLADFLMKEIFGNEKPIAAIAGNPDSHRISGTIPRDIEDLTESEAESLLIEELKKLHGAQQ
jgi:acyl carrier protein